MGDDNEIQLVPGDLIVFTGYTYTPDYVYKEHYNNEPEYGIVVRSRTGFYEGSLYDIFWLKTGRITQCPLGHIKLAYTRE